MTPTTAGWLQRALAGAPYGAICVGFSGGLDSTVLLHALAASDAARARGLRALHIDHALHADSAAWAGHCRRFAAALDVPLTVERVAVGAARGLGLEAVARTARHAAFATALAPGELLALAHHRDDQTETVLLKLLRGAGPEGLAGMRALRACGAGHLWRPLLDVPRDALRAYAHAHGLAVVDDPSNADTRHARNFLRADVLPLVRRRWAQADAAIAHSARWLAQAAEYLDEAAHAALAPLRGVDPATLRWREWLALPDALRANALRLWLRDLDLSTPEILHIEQLERQLARAESDKLPCVAWAGTEIRRYRDHIHAMAPLQAPPVDWRVDAWDGSPLALPAGCGRLSLEPVDAHAARPDGVALTVAFRRGGERLRPAGDRHTRELRDLMQHAGMPPWRRGRVPLVSLGDTLVAVGDYWLSEDGAAWLGRQRLRVVWSGETQPSKRARCD
ncbi:tRNA lysidine(34) synthetase TilS [Tahibacter soli]|uniref:tRNA(Ile)-lysidine synthase n=1 Tax=Tahibacter soli TaxID=2983605 RepID=A0A9X4BGZ9_9GAMM|nr:tRNA lysidine(34) synthetase TilS [Tahibacter soli]MDC8012191.1 tRNA lysidine(34) synthetase TilS [Tahibacter soli]